MRRQRTLTAWACIVLGAIALLAVVTGPSPLSSAGDIGGMLVVLAGLCGVGVVVFWGSRLSYWLSWVAPLLVAVALVWFGIFT